MPEEQKVEQNCPSDRPYCFSSLCRLKSRRHIQALFKNGRLYRNGSLTFVYQTDGKKHHATLLVSVKKKYGNSPRRNRAKRLVRECFRHSELMRRQGLVFSVVISPPVGHLTINSIALAFKNFARHLNNEPHP